MRSTCALLLLVMFAGGQPARADKPGPPVSYTQVTANKKFVLVLFALDPMFEGDPKTGQALRALFPKSGLYKNDGSKEPLWSVDWHRNRVYVAGDGIHLVREGNWPKRGKPGDRGPSVSKKDLEQESFSFFANGKLLRQYPIGEIIDDPQALPKSVSHFRWLHKASVLDDTKQFEAITLDGNRIVFDLATAKVLRKEKVNLR
jgi:hypothetical protein